MAETEVARVLVKDGRQKGVAKCIADDVIGVLGGGAFCESSGAPAEAGIGVLGLAKARDNHGDGKGVGVNGSAELELEFLRGSERDGIAVVGDVE